MVGRIPAAPPLLVFTSWWQESDKGKSVRRDAELSFDQDGGCSIFLDRDRSKVYRLSHVVGKYGPVEAVDLFVGARLHVLGRDLTLRQANLETVTWLAAEAARLDAIEAGLLFELAKYGDNVRSLPSGKRVCGFDGGRQRPDQFREKQNGASLRNKVRDIEFLQGRIREVRLTLDHGHV
ncbi:hypothetical protein M885DRAFT_545965 [Pelagophyceae sp. CCMP2097]|nr:hypothetical protein M885DRAFT_545965 [Pelagophyceae sp. CCMP2097]|mmetsp:Transcript_32644/g.112967  ORF Transcript_32644/g.112967 Transcript_32644/m.112967 type:complete len:179 (+) Transcript_32644:112-648(+)